MWSELSKLLYCVIIAYGFSVIRVKKAPSTYHNLNGGGIEDGQVYFEAPIGLECWSPCGFSCARSTGCFHPDGFDADLEMLETFDGDLHSLRQPQYKSKSPVLRTNLPFPTRMKLLANPTCGSLPLPTTTTNLSSPVRHPFFMGRDIQSVPCTTYRTPHASQLWPPQPNN